MVRNSQVAKCTLFYVRGLSGKCAAILNIPRTGHVALM